MDRHGPWDSQMCNYWMPKKSKMSPLAFKARIQATNIHYRLEPIPVLNQNEPYTYHGINLAPSLKWKTQIHTTTTTTKVVKQCKELVACPATMQQKIIMADTVIRAGIAYSFYTVPYFLPAIKKLDKKIIVLTKQYVEFQSTHQT